MDGPRQSAQESGSLSGSAQKDPAGAAADRVWEARV